MLYQKIQAIWVKRNVKVRSLNHSYHGNIPSLSVFLPNVPAREAHAPYHIVFCGLPGCTIFFHNIS
jgi:hypothetical protein